MAINLDFFSSYNLIASVKQVVPRASFFRDRYFPTGAGDLFASDKVLVEYQDGDRKMAPFVAPHVGDIPVARDGYTVSEYAPPRIAPSRILSIDDLAKRGFGEALFADMDQAQRAARIQVQDMQDLDGRIARREEWMCAQTIINNACTVQEYIDAATAGESKSIVFYTGATTDHTYSVGTAYWNGQTGDFFGDVKAMARMLSKKGLPAADLILGTDAADAILDIQKVRDLLDKNSGIITGEIRQSLTQYDGVAFMGVLNFGGFMLNLFSVDEEYVDASGTAQKYFPAKSAAVTAPGAGHLMYGQITQIDFGSSDFTTHVGARVPKLVVDQANDVRKLVLTARPLAAPKNRSPWIYAANVIN